MLTARVKDKSYWLTGRAKVESTFNKVLLVLPEVDANLLLTDRVSYR